MRDMRHSEVNVCYLGIRVQWQCLCRTATPLPCATLGARVLSTPAPHVAVAGLCVFGC